MPNYKEVILGRPAVNNCEINCCILYEFAKSKLKRNEYIIALQMVNYENHDGNGYVTFECVTNYCMCYNSKILTINGNLCAMLRVKGGSIYLVDTTEIKPDEIHLFQIKME